MAIKQERMNQIILKEVTQIIQFELKDPNVGFVTITDVHVSFLGKEERNAAGLKALNRSKGFIRSTLAKRLTIRKTPEIIFKLDKSLEQGKRIENLIQSIHKD